MRNKIAFQILDYWGYTGTMVGDLDGRNHAAWQKERVSKGLYVLKDRSHKTEKAVAHAFRLADIAIEVFRRSL